jgi:hypothetical protein
LRHAQAVGGIRIHQRGGDTLRPHHPPGGIARVCKRAVTDEIAPRIPGIRYGSSPTFTDSE